MSLIPLAMSLATNATCQRPFNGIAYIWSHLLAPSLRCKLRRGWALFGPPTQLTAGEWGGHERVIRAGRAGDPTRYADLVPPLLKTAEVLFASSLTFFARMSHPMLTFHILSLEALLWWGKEKKIGATGKLLISDLSTD